MGECEGFVVFCISLSVLLVLVSRISQKNWLQVSMVAFTVLGSILVAVPQIAGPPLLMISGSTGDVHFFLIRACGVVCLGSGLNIYLNYTSVDAYSRISLLFCVFLTAALESVVNILTPITMEKSKGATFGSLWLYKNIANAAAQLMFVFMGKDFFGHSQLHSRLNVHMKIDSVLNLFQGIILMTYPSLVLQWLTKNTDFDTVEVILTQTYGAFCIGSGVLSMLYSSALLHNDKRSILLSRVLETLAVIVLIVYTNATGKVLGGCVQATLLLYAMLSFNALLGYYSPHETDSYASQDD